MRPPKNLAGAVKICQNLPPSQSKKLSALRTGGLTSRK